MSAVAPKAQTPAERFLLQPAGRWLERTVGVVALLFGALLLFGTLFGAYGMVSKPTTSVMAGAFAVVVLALLGVLLFVAGVRLVLGLPNSDGALFVPAVWFAIAASMLCLAVFFLVVLVPKGIAEAGQGLVLALLPALLAFGAAAHFRRKARERREA